MHTTLVFDLDDTLYDLMRSFAETHEELFASRTAADSASLFAASRKHNAKAFELWNQGKLTKKEEFAYRIRESYREFGLVLKDEEIEAFEGKYRYRQKHLKLSPDMTEFLSTLKDHGIPMILLTNGNHKDQWAKIESLGLTHFIPEEQTFVSEDLPGPKPETVAFKTVEKRLGLDPRTTWYIGDTFEIDILGAFNAGWHSVWFNHRHKKATTDDIRPDYEANSLSELKEIIRSICMGTD